MISHCNASDYRLRPKAWTLPGLPWVFGLMYIFLAVVEEPFRGDLMGAGIIALIFGGVCVAAVLTSRVIVSRAMLDVRDYGVRKRVQFKNLTRVYTIPSTFSTILAFDDDAFGTADIHR